MCEEVSFLGELKRQLDERPAGTTTVDTLREFLSHIEAPDDAAQRRKRVMTANPSLKRKMRASLAELEPMLAESIAKDLGAGPGDIRPLLIAASMTAAFTSMRDRFMDAEEGGEPMTHEQGMAILDQVLDFLRGGLEAMQGD